MLRLFLLIYTILFFGGAMIWPSYRTWRATGVNPYRLPGQVGLPGFVGGAFRLILLALIALVLLHVAFPGATAYLGPIVWLQSPLAQGIGVALLLVAVAVVVTAQAQMGRSWRIGIDDQHDTALVTRGIFDRSRNPIFLGMRVMLVGLFLVLPNAATLALWLVGDVLIRTQVYLEEEHLLRQHGQAYQAYQQRVRRWI